MPLGRFNFYLALGLVVWAMGCGTPEQKRMRKLQTTIRLHLTARPAEAQTREPVDIAGARVYVEKTSFLDERGIEKASIVDSEGESFAIRLDCNDHGRMVLEGVTAASRGRQIAVFCQFGTKKELNKGAWLAAPLVTTRISDGRYEFAPTVDRQTAEEIVQGLNNVIKKLNRPLSW